MNKPQAAIARRAGVVAAGTLSSRIAGFVRDAVIAASFGVSVTDAFFLAFTIPNALRVLLGEGAVSGAFVPVLTKVKAQDADRTREFFANLLGAMLLILGLVVVIGVLGAEVLVELYASGFRRDADLFALTVQLTRLVFPYIGLMGIAAVFTGALHTYKRFFAPAFGPVLLNLSLIAAALFLAPHMQHLGWPAIASLAVGALIGGTLHIVVLIPSLRASGLSPFPRFRLSDPHVRTALGRLVPLIAALGVYQLNIIASRQLASYLPEGSLSFLYYGQRLVELPQGMFALAIGTAALPTLAELATQGNRDEAKRIFRYGLRLSLFVAIPSAVGLAVLAEPICAVVFGRGNFDATAIAQTAYSLVFLAAGIWAVASARTVIPMFHALGDTRSPVVASGVNLVVFFALSLALMGPMAHAGLAVAMTAAAAAQLGTLLIMLRRKVGPLQLSEVLLSALRTSLAAAAMGGFLWLARGFTDWSVGATVRTTGVAALSVSIAIGIFFGVATLLRAPETRELRDALRRRKNRSPVAG